MDPLVRASIALQRTGARASGAVVSVGAGAFLVWWTMEPRAEWMGVAAGGVLIASLGLRVARRLGKLNPASTARLDFEVFSHLVVLAFAAILASPGKLEGPFYPMVYALMMLAAAFARPAAAVATVAFTVLLEAAIQMLALGHELERGWPHAALIGLFAFMNMVVFRAEIARVRRLSKVRIASEIERMKEAARSYRLLGAPSSALDRTSLPPPDDEERLLRSSVEEIHQALSFALDLLRRSLGLSSAVLLWLDGSKEKLHIRELSTSDDTIMPGPFSARDGIIAAALSQGETVSVHGHKLAHHTPYYGAPPAIGAVSAAPILENGHARGVLVVDRQERDPFTSVEEELLTAATHFALRAIENERVFAQLERAKIEQGKLYRAVDALAAASTEAAVVEACVSSAREFASFDFAVVTLFDRQTGEHEICAVSGDGGDELLGQRFRHNSGLVSMVVANRHPLPYRGDYDPARQLVFTRRLKPPAMPSLLVLPLTVHDRALGTLVLGSRRRSAFGDAVRPTLEVLASHVAVSLANARMVKRLEEMATTDGLTGLFNKRALLEAATQKLKSAARFKKALSVLVCDIDHFKKVNDTYGHDVGDVVIRGFGEVLKRTKRDTDVVGRFGGEEFVIVCEETDSDGAALLAERIRSEIESTTFHSDAGALRVTCSVGVATAPQAGTDWDSLFKATDEALYASKRGGRNRVTVWAPRLSGCAA
ncbi:MAG: diguanylate cyclase [Myxococcales bacterium]|nr:diguanylate cyclase [Myxococcales bacterium]MCB9582889.1 diguanylate cyclase [Polyangiaceae bacterium]